MMEKKWRVWDIREMHPVLFYVNATDEEDVLYKVADYLAENWGVEWSLDSTYFDWEPV